MPRLVLLMTIFIVSFHSLANEKLNLPDGNPTSLIMGQLRQLHALMGGSSSLTLESFSHVFGLKGGGIENQDAPPFAGGVQMHRRYRKLSFFKSIPPVDNVAVEVRAGRHALVSSATLRFEAKQCVEFETLRTEFEMKQYFPSHPNPEAKYIRYIGKYGVSEVWTDMKIIDGTNGATHPMDKCARELSFRLPI